MIIFFALELRSFFLCGNLIIECKPSDGRNVNDCFFFLSTYRASLIKGRSKRRILCVESSDKKSSFFRTSVSNSVHAKCDINEKNPKVYYLRFVKYNICLGPFLNVIKLSVIL